MNTRLISKFLRRLSTIGIDTKLFANYPWVYLEAVNGIQISEVFQADHGFTAFFTPVRPEVRTRFSDRSAVFKKIRSVLDNPGDQH